VIPAGTGRWRPPISTPKCWQNRRQSGRGRGYGERVRVWLAGHNAAVRRPPGRHRRNLRPRLFALIVSFHRNGRGASTTMLSQRDVSAFALAHQSPFWTDRARVTCWSCAAGNGPRRGVIHDRPGFPGNQDVLLASSPADQLALAVAWQPVAGGQSCFVLQLYLGNGEDMNPADELTRQIQQS